MAILTVLNYLSFSTTAQQFYIWRKINEEKRVDRSQQVNELNVATGKHTEMHLLVYVYKL